MKDVSEGTEQRVERPPAKVAEIETLLRNPDRSAFLAYVDSHDLRSAFADVADDGELTTAYAAGMQLIRTRRTEMRFVLRPDGSGIVVVLRDGEQVADVSWPEERVDGV